MIKTDFKNISFYLIIGILGASFFALLFVPRNSSQAAEIEPEIEAISEASFDANPASSTQQIQTIIPTALPTQATTAVDSSTVYDYSYGFPILPDDLEYLENLIDTLYLNLLQRRPDEESRADLIANTISGEITGNDILNIFYYSDEFQSLYPELSELEKVSLVSSIFGFENFKSLEDLLSSNEWILYQQDHPIISGRYQEIIQLREELEEELDNILQIINMN